LREQRATLVGALERLAAEIGGSQVVPADLSDPAEAERVWQAAGEVDILINNAGLGGSGDFARPDTWERERHMLDVNVVAATLLAKRALGQMIPRRSGRILNVASLAAWVPGPNMAIYFASKAYLRSLSDALHHEAKGRGVTVTALCPGPVDTAFFDAGGLRGGRRMLPASDVARAGWDGMLAGRRTVIPGAEGKALATVSSLLPRALLLRIAARTLNHRP
ncbi:SDR family NAD(P)-dependent oxidoreductase, partial [Palleronia sp.]|uniref:SDR family NAD(P)-dependent oxidoreductase n=1 Tax=Palleronia sp. TaxID=1940284 RepID=UPI0035C858C8